MLSIKPLPKGEVPGMTSKLIRSYLRGLKARAGPVTAREYTKLIPIGWIIMPNGFLQKAISNLKQDFENFKENI